MPDQENVRWCPDCKEPHIGGCPWAELEHRADPTVPMPRERPDPGIATKLIAAFAELGESARPGLILFVATLPLVFAVAFQFESAATEQEIRAHEMRVQVERTRMHIEEMEREVALARERAERAQAAALERERRLIEALSGE